jgi:anti-sigma-K factor RskA
LHADGSGSLVSEVDLRGGADAVAVTLESAGGRPQPEGPIVLVGKI